MSAPWETVDGVRCVVCPECHFTFAAWHVNLAGEYSCPDCVRAEVEVLRKALESLFPVEEGFTEAFDDLVMWGLIVPVPADQQFKDEWGADTMYVWRWSPLARGEGKPEGGP